VPTYVTVPQESTSVSVISNPKNAADKVLAFVQHATANSPRPVIKTNGVNLQSPYFTFVSDVYINGKRTGSIMNELFFTGNGGDLFRLQVQHDSAKNEVRLKKWTINATSDFATPVVLKQNAWFNLRIDFYVNGTNSYINIYIDGVLVASEQNYYYNASIVANSTCVDNVQWQVNSGNNNGYAWYFDDLAFVNNYGSFIK
jgi:hypothetical protein